MHNWAGTHRSPFESLVRTVATLVITTVALAIGGLALPATAHAGVGVAPVIIEVDDALRGGRYVNTLILTNTDDENAATFTVTPVGDIVDWISVSLTGEAPADTFVVPAGSRITVDVTIDVPAEAANSSYEGGLEVLGSTGEVGDGADDDVASGVQMGGLVLVTVDVTGTEKRAASVVDYQIANAEVGMDQRFSAIISNDGNVQAIGRLDVEIRRDGQTVAQLTTDGEPWVVLGGSTGPVEVLWPTSEQAAGDYTATFTVSDVATATPVELDVREIPFRLEPLGTFTRSGELVDFAIASQVGLDVPIVAAATFANTGEIDTTGVLQAKLYRGDELLAVTQSLERVAPVGENVTMSATFEISEPGTYRIEGQVNYDGELTETKAFDLEIDSAGAVQITEVGTGGGTNVSAIVALLALGALIVLGAFVERVIVRRPRRGGDDRVRTRTAPARAEEEAPTTSPATATSTAKSKVSLAADSWLQSDGEREIDPELLAAAMAELDAELGLDRNDRIT
jgi:hypothetical protein